MAQVTIGDTQYEVPELNFAALELVWPHVEEAMTTLDPMKGPSAGLYVIAGGIIHTDTFDKTKFGILEMDLLTEKEILDQVVRYLKRQLKASQISGIKDCLDKITEEAGLIPKEGERDPVKQENPSPETAPASSLN